MSGGGKTEYKRNVPNCLCVRGIRNMARGARADEIEIRESCEFGQSRREQVLKDEKNTLIRVKKEG
jgi:hypothetical protein